MAGDIRSLIQRRAALLLEVVVALAIMVGALGIVSAEMVNSINMVSRADQETRACELTDRLLALLELDQNLQQRVFLDRATTGEFGDDYPGYFWRVDAQPTDVEGLKTIIIEVLWQGETGGKKADISQARTLRKVALLKADPGRINLATDFGLEDEQMQQLTQSIPIPGFDPTQFDPQALVSMDPATLLALLPQIMPLLQTMFGGRLPADLASGNMTPDQLREMITNLQKGQMPGGGGANGGTPGVAGGAGNLGNGGGAKSPTPGVSGGAGGQPPGGGQRSGSGMTLEDLKKLSPTGGAGAGAGAGGNNGRTNGTPPPGNVGRGGNPSGGQRGTAGNSPSGNGQQHYTIEDLMRMRNQGGR